MQIPKDDLIRYGAVVKHLAESGVLQAALEFVSADYTNVFLNSLPHEKEKREIAYYSNQALADVAQTLTYFAATYDLQMTSVTSEAEDNTY